MLLIPEHLSVPETPSCIKHSLDVSRSSAFPLSLLAVARGGNCSAVIPFAEEPGAACALPARVCCCYPAWFLGRETGKFCQGMVLTTQFSPVWH